MHRRRAWAICQSLAASTTLLWLFLSALGCTSGTRVDRSPEAAGAGGSVTAPVPSPPTSDPPAPGEPSGSGGGQSYSGSGAAGSLANGPADSGPRPTDGGFDAAPSGPTDSSAAPSDAVVVVGQQPGCPAELPEVYAICPKEGLMCEYGMQCCPDFAYCEFGQWTLLTHHCDACI